MVATYKATGKLDDRSGLSQEMADLCVNLPIYRVVKQNDIADQTSDSGDADPAEIPGQGKSRIGLAKAQMLVVFNLQFFFTLCR